MKIAIIKDFLALMRGAEKVLDILCELYPEADIYALFHNKGALTPNIERHKIRTSFIQRLPNVKNYYYYYLPLFPTAIEQFDLRDYDLVISESQCAAKGARTRPDALHLCYCLTPMRYVWDMYTVYFPPQEMGLAKRALVSAMANYLRRWDVQTQGRVHRYIAISTCVAERIKRWYGRDSDVIFPSADEQFYTLSHRQREDTYLVASALVPYKRFDLAIEAFKRLGKRLVIIGTGQDAKKLRNLARGAPHIEFLGWQSNEVLREHYQRCCALLYPGEEDFGIVPVEAQLCGMPVIAYGKGGVLDTLIDGETGVFFKEQTVEALCLAVEKFEKMSFNPARIRANGERFGTERFKREFSRYVQSAYSEFVKKGRPLAAAP